MAQIHDSSADYRALTMLVKQLRLFGSITVLDLGDAQRVSRNTVRDALGGIDSFQLGNRLVGTIVAQYYVGTCHLFRGAELPFLAVMKKAARWEPLLRSHFLLYRKDN